MSDITVFIYEDESLKRYLGCYRALFGSIPLVGDLISKHVHIKNAKLCKVVEVRFIPKIDKNSPDADALIYAFITERVDFV